MTIPAQAQLGRGTLRGSARRGRLGRFAVWGAAAHGVANGAVQAWPEIASPGECKTTRSFNTGRILNSLLRRSGDGVGSDDLVADGVEDDFAGRVQTKLLHEIVAVGFGGFHAAAQ